jgi:serine protease Do
VRDKSRNFQNKRCGVLWFNSMKNKENNLDNIENNIKEIGSGLEETSPFQKKGMPKFSIIIILAIFLSSVFGAIFGFMAGNISKNIPALQKFQLGKNQNQSSQSSLQAERQQVTNEDNLVTDLVQKSIPAVVSIVISKNVSVLQNQNFFNDPFGFFSNPNGNGGSSGNNSNNSGTQKQTIGGGSGFFVSSNGMIVTNKHVVEDASADYTVITNDGKEYPAKILARDPAMDLAVIKIDGDNFPVLDLGDSDSAKIGQTIISIGNSLGQFSNTVTKGIISGLKRNVTAGSDSSGSSEQLSNIIQIDAPINPGNSGGPLLDLDGNVIGINVAMAQGAENIAFSIPINQVKKVIEQVKSNGKISVPFLGVRYVIVGDSLQKQNNLPFDYGALVLRGQTITDFAVVPGSPADKAGIVENDIILEANGQKIDNSNPLSNVLNNFGATDTITLKIWHKGNTKDIQVQLQERKN